MSKLRNDHERTAIATANDLMRLIAQVEMFGASVTAPLLSELEPFLTSLEDGETREMYVAAYDFVLKLQRIRNTGNPGRD